MKALVTGGSGFIGSHLVKHLLNANWDVKVLDLRKPNQNVEWIAKDMREDLENAFSGIDYVFHLASVSDARKCAQHPNHCIATNIGGTVNVLRAALRAGVSRVVLASSAWVAGAQIGDIVDETTPFKLTAVNTIYATSKLTQEMLCYSFLSEHGGPAYTILRYGTPYGERMWKGLVVRSFMFMAEFTGKITIMGDGKQYREFLYVGDLCHAQMLATSPVGVNKVYNLTGLRRVTVEELAKEIIKHFPASIDYKPLTRIEPNLKRIKSDLAKDELGWTPKTSLAEGIERCVAWWKGLDQVAKEEDYWL